MVTKKTVAEVGEAGPEAVVPLTEFYEKLEELFNKQNEFIKQNKPLPNWQAGTSF